MTPEYWLISDIDGTLTGDGESLAQLAAQLRHEAGRIGFGVATGRSPELTRAAISEFALPEPTVSICAVGSQIQGAGISTGTAEGEWPGPRSRDFSAERVRELLSGLPGLELQPPEGQGPYKASFLASAGSTEEASDLLATNGLPANLIHSAGEYLDVLPVGVSKGAALRFLAGALGLGLDRFVVAGDTGNDLDLLTCGAKAVLVGNHAPEVAHLEDHPLVYVAQRAHAAGIIEGMTHYGLWSG